MTTTATKTCAIDGCDRPVKGRGWCGTHHERWRRHGSPHAVNTPGAKPSTAPRRKATCSSCGRTIRTSQTVPVTCHDCVMGTGPGAWQRQGLILRFIPAQIDTESEAA